MGKGTEGDGQTDAEEVKRQHSTQMSGTTVGTLRLCGHEDPKESERPAQKSTDLAADFSTHKATLTWLGCSGAPWVNLNPH